MSLRATASHVRLEWQVTVGGSDGRSDDQDAAACRAGGGQCAGARAAPSSGTPTALATGRPADA